MKRLPPLASLAIALLTAVLVHRFAPFPSADTSRASEDAFADGLEEREFVAPMMAPGRWTTHWASFDFRHLPTGGATLHVRVRNHQNDVRVMVGRRLVGYVPEGASAGQFELASISDGKMEVDLLVTPFLARGGRRLGAFLDRVRVVHRRTWWPGLALIALFATPALAAVLAALWAGLPGMAALGAATLTSITQALLLWPQGVVRSTYALQLTAILVGAVVCSLAFARLIGRSGSEKARWTFMAFLVAFLVQGAAATHPMVIALDANFHAHNLVDVANGDLFPTSLTQHRPPFRFPYGVSFYAILSPFVWARWNLVAVVRVAASVAGIALSAALSWLVARQSPRRAALTLVLLQFIPWSFEVYSNGNYSNVFAQAAASCFFVWWAGGSPGSWPLGALFFVLGALGHLSSFIVLVTLSASLVLVHRKNIFGRGHKLATLGAGLGIALVYYVQFWELIMGQIPRLFAGGHGGTGATSVGLALTDQLREIYELWGMPVIVLAIFGWPRGHQGIDPDLRAFWLTGGILGLAAIVTPLEVRYLYALTLPLAIAGASGTAWLFERGALAKFLAAGLVVSQIAIGLRTIAEAILYDWRV